MSSKELTRVHPKPPAQWDEVDTDALRAFPGPFNNVLSGWRDHGIAIAGSNAVSTFALNPPLAKAFLTFNAHTATANTLSKRICELVILRLSWLLKCEYAFIRHIAAGKRAGITDEEIELIQIGPDAPGWDANEADLLRAVDEMHGDDACISDTTWARLATQFSTPQLLDLIFVIGCYWTVSMMMSSCRLPLEEVATPLEPEVRARMLNQKFRR